MTDSMSEVVERLAKAIVKESRKPSVGLSNPQALIRAALTELSAMGLVVVPVEPTEGMVRAMTALAPTWDDETSRRKWAAAIAASKVQP